MQTSQPLPPQPAPMQPHNNDQLPVAQAVLPQDQFPAVGAGNATHPLNHVNPQQLLNPEHPVEPVALGEPVELHSNRQSETQLNDPNTNVSQQVSPLNHSHHRHLLPIIIWLGIPRL